MNLFDSSALLCFLQGDAGAVGVEAALDEGGGCCSAVNWSEAAQKAHARSGDWDLARAVLASYGLLVEPVTQVDAELAATLWRSRSGLSLADRVCLATGERPRRRRLHRRLGIGGSRGASGRCADRPGRASARLAGVSGTPFDVGPGRQAWRRRARSRTTTPCCRRPSVRADHGVEFCIMMYRCGWHRHVRTTIDLPADLHRVALSLARDSGRSLSETVADLMRRALRLSSDGADFVSPVTGLPVVRLGGGPITSDDVRQLEDE